MPVSFTYKGVKSYVFHKRRSIFSNLLVFSILILIAYSVIVLAERAQTPLNSSFNIDLSITALPYYAALSTLRMTVAYIISLIFSFIYARAAVSSRRAEGILIPVLDILQSIPILSFMPGVVLGLVALFPNSNWGLELAAVLLIFTSQAWNITFGFYQTLLTIPGDLEEVAAMNRLGFWQKFTRLELPAGVISLIWNSMMSWAGGWFFLMASEQFTLGNHDFRLPGLGSYLQAAGSKGNIPALMVGILTLVFIIILLDQLMWRPLVAWADRFKMEQNESGDAPRSWFLDLCRKSSFLIFLRKKLFHPLGVIIDSFLTKATSVPQASDENVQYQESAFKKFLKIALTIICLALVVLGLYNTFQILIQLHFEELSGLFLGAGATFLRTVAALALAVLWTVPVGVAIGLSPKWSKRLQPVVQMAASVPATALFPALLLILLVLPSGLDFAAIILMLLGTQWYLLFNVIAGAMAIPNDLKEATTIYHLTGFNRWRYLILPSIFPYLVTGLITATGGAWNASIVSEFVNFGGKNYTTVGLGATIASAANSSNFPLLLASTILMAFIVFIINKFCWQKIYRLAEQKYHFE